MKNYVLHTMEGTDSLTATEAAGVLKAWNEGAKFVMVNGSAIATHQIKKIVRIDAEQETRALISAGLLASDGFGNAVKDEKYQKVLEANSIEAALSGKSIKQISNAN
jgi:hypothetical protein